MTDQIIDHGGRLVGTALDLEARNRDVPRDIRLAWATKVTAFILAALLVPELAHRELIFVLLVTILPIQVWWHRFLPNARLQSIRPLHDSAVAAAAAMIAPSLWVPAVLIYGLGATDPAYRKRPKATNIAMLLIGLVLLAVGATAGPDTWIVTSIVAIVMIVLRGQTGGKVWSELEAIERQRSTLLESVSAVVWTADPIAGTVTWVSPNIERVMGWTTEDWLAIPQADLIHPDDIESFWIDSGDLVIGHEYIRAARYRHKDGRWIWLNMVTTPLSGPTK